MTTAPDAGAGPAAPALLTVSVGNTRTAVGLFAPGAPLVPGAFATSRRRTAEECAVLVRSWLERHRPGRPPAIARVAIASVVPPSTAVWREVAGRLGAADGETRVYGEDGDLGIDVRVRMPARAVGADRLLNALAARARFGAPVLVVDVGTALTLDVVDGAGAFVGGAIAPGPVTAAGGLWRRAPSLAPVAFAVPARAVGRTTEAALRAGIGLGAAGQIDALVRAARAELGAPSAPVVATGGLGEALAGAAAVVDHVEPWLTLRGLALWARGWPAPAGAR